MDYNVILASPVWSLNGVNVFSANLVRGLRDRGIAAHILLTDRDRPDPKPMDLPSDIPVSELPVGKFDSYQMRWQVMIRYLEERSPCIYIPNYDFFHSCVSPKLSNRIGIVGIIHSDDPLHYEHVERLGRYWNSIVAVSQTIAQVTALRHPELSSRLVTIPYGVSIPDRHTERPLTSNDPTVPLKIVYAGIMNQRQKRVLDLPKIIQALQNLQVPVQLTIAGGGEFKTQLMEASHHLVEQGVVRFVGLLPNEMIPALYEQQDVFIMTSAYEGMPNALLEAMGRGCVPVVTDIDSGIPELVQDGFNGFRVPVGGIQMFAERLSLLQRDVHLRRQMSRNAYATVDKGHYRVQDMAERYLELFHQVLQQADSGTYCRPYGDILPPLRLRPFHKRFFPLRIRKRGKETLRRALQSFDICSKA